MKSVRCRCDALEARGHVEGHSCTKICPRHCDQRPDWDEYFVNLAQSVSARGDCRRSQVGAVIVDKSRIVVATGYNGVDPGEAGCLDGACPRGLKSYGEHPRALPYDGRNPCIARHAESNAIRFARRARQGPRLLGATIYVTREPCIQCMEEICISGIERWVFTDAMGSNPSCDRSSSPADSAVLV